MSVPWLLLRAHFPSFVWLQVVLHEPLFPSCKKKKKSLCFSMKLIIYNTRLSVSKAEIPLYILVAHYSKCGLLFHCVCVCVRV